MNATYYANDLEPNLRDVLTVGERPRTTPLAIRPEVASSYVDAFGGGTGTPSGWTTGPNTATPTMSDSVMTVRSVGGTPAYGWVAKTVTTDLGAYPILRISILSAGSGWSLKVNAHTTDDPNFPDTVIQTATATPGVYTYNIASLMGWSGTKSFRIRIFTSGASNTVKVDDIRMQTVATGVAAVFDDGFNGSLDPAWVPAHATASASNGVLYLEATASSPGYGYVNRALSTYDVDKYPYVQITVSSVAQQWSLKVVRGTTTVVLENSASALGTFTYNLPALTGWHGSQSLTLQIMANGTQQPITVDDIQVAAPDAPAEAFRDEFGSSNNTSSCDLSSTGLDKGWAVVAGTTPCAQTVGGLLHLSRSASTGYGSIRRFVTVDVSEYPMLFVSVPSVTGGWVLRVSSDPTLQTPAIQLQPLMLQGGRFTYDIPKKTGWSGTKTFYIQLDAAGYTRPDGSVVDPAITFDYIGIRAADAAPWVTTATSTTNSWTPHQLSFTGSYADGMSISGHDVFHDANSVGRSMSVTGFPSTKDLQLSGLYRGTVSYNAATRVMTVTGADFRYAVVLPAAASVVVRYYSNKDTMLRGGPARVLPSDSSGYWTATFTGLASSTVNVGIGFARTGESQGSEAARAQAAVASSAVANDPGARAAFWDTFLQEVPKPVNFDVQGGQPSNGVTPTETRALYYRAWVFLQSQVIEPETETGQTYPQFTTGKASLYRAGPPGASATATWDSELGLQLLAYVDPVNAWGGLQEIASLIPSSGAWPGEPLPAREMQTAWILYMVTGDGSKLAGVYPSLKNLLQYKVAHLSYGSSTTKKDAAFASSVLVDLAYAEKIAAIVGDTTTDWAGTASGLLTQVKSWFWVSASTQPVQYYDSAASPTRTVGHVMSTTPLMYVPDLDATRTASAYALFNTLYDPTKPLAGFGDGGASDVVENDVRYGIVDYTTYGLLKDGKSTDAQNLVNAIMRDTVIADSLSERYQWSTTSAPHGEGNTPSDFGAAELIWTVWLNNGYRFDDGTPSFVSLSGAEGGIDNLKFHGYVLNLAIDAPSAQATLTGSIVTAGGGCNTLSVPVGATVSLSAPCSEAY